VNPTNTHTTSKVMDAQAGASRARIRGRLEQ
jgi:hypothetical protein